MNPSNLSERELIENVKKNNCSQSLLELNNRHSGVVRKMTYRYGSVFSKFLCSGVTSQDFLDNQLTILYKAAKSYDFDRKTKFSSHLCNSARFFCLNTFRKEKKYYNPTPEMSKIEPESVSPESQNPLKLEIEYIFCILNKLKDKKVKKIIEMHYFGETPKQRSFAYIAKTLGISPQGALDIHNHFISFIKNKVKATERMDEV